MLNKSSCKSRLSRYSKRSTCCHPKLDLESLCYNGEALNRWPAGFQGDGTRRGFTLIELLVVVLIIGILAAVALPQYQKAVFKSQATEAFANLKTMKNALDVCELANGRVSDNNEYCRTVENLDVKIGEVTAAGGTDSFYTDKFRYTVDRGGITAQPNIAVSALMRGNPYEVCICLYDDGHFSTYNNMDNCVNEHYPNFNIAKTLNISEDANCVCC